MPSAGKWAGLATIGILSIALAGCGTQSINASKWMSVHPSSKTIDLKVESTYSSSLQSAVFDGYTRGKLTITIPVGYHVNMDFINNGPIPESIGIYHHHHLAFTGAGQSYHVVSISPTAGILPGHSHVYRFTANQVGTYTVADLLNGDPNNQPTSDLWDTVKVVPKGTPAMSVS